MNNEAQTDETFAKYLAKYYIAKKSYTYETVPEVEQLAKASDIVLMRSDGFTFQIICIVDRDAHPEKQFSLPRETVLEIGKKCLKYAGKVNSSQMPIHIQIMEVGTGISTASDHQRLAVYKRPSLFSKTIVRAWSIDTASQDIWTNAHFIEKFAIKKQIENLLIRPRASGDELVPKSNAAIQGYQLPILTCVMLLVLAIVFFCEQLFGIGESTGLLEPSLQTLIALGASNKNLVFESGEWYRIFSATVLHGDALHLLFNSIALFFVGNLLETLVGRTRFFALFVIGAVSGSLLSLAVNPATVVSVGASGAIMCLFAAAFVTTFRLPYGSERNHAQVSLLRVLIPSLLPLATEHGGQVDYAAHIGGAVGGTVVGFFMLKTWPHNEIMPRFKTLATIIVTLGLLAYGYSIVPIKQQYSSYVLDMPSMPESERSKSDAEVTTPATETDEHFNLGVCYANGIGVMKNEVEAVKCYLKAADQGHAEAQYLLGLSYDNGTGVVKNEVEALKWYHKAADQGNADAQYLLGISYYNGEGVVKNEVEAAKWYLKAADQGHAEAQYLLGLSYDNGTGVVKNKVETLKWYHKAADQGHAEAQYLIGLSYDNGEGVVKNEVEAVKWYLKAADQGHACAQFNLGVSYANGEGVVKNDMLAYQWILIAAANNAPTAEENIPAFEARITDDQRAEGQRLATEWQADFEKRVIENNE